MATECRCSSELCEHEPHECGDPVTHPYTILDGEQAQIGVCDECWETFKKHNQGYVPETGP